MCSKIWFSKMEWVQWRVPKLPVKDCAASPNNLAPRCLKLTAIDVTAKTILERFYLVPVHRQFALFITMPSALTTPQLTQRLFLDFCSNFSRVAPQFFCQHDSPSNLAESRYPRPMIRTNGTIFYSMLYFKSWAVYMRLNHMYSIISVSKARVTTCQY